MAKTMSSSQFKGGYYPQYSGLIETQLDGKEPASPPQKKVKTAAYKPKKRAK